MKFRATKGDATEVKTPALVLNLYQGVEKPGGATGAVDKALGGRLSKMIEDGEITGIRGETKIVHTGGAIGADRVAVIGLGKREDCDLEAIRRAVGSATRELLKSGLTRWHTVLHGGAGLATDEDLTARDLAQAVAEATALGAYRFDRYKTVDDEKERSKGRLDTVTVVESDGRKIAAIRKGLSRGAKIAEAVCYTRDLGNSPPNDMTPAALATEARKLGRKHKMRVQILTMKELQRRGMGGIIGVGQGSRNTPRLIIVRYDGGKKGAKPTILVGKAVTFDTGGISIKPSRAMDEMKFDKMGGCAVLGILKAAALLGLKKNLIGVVPAVENMPGGDSYRPGDILSSYSGKTIEVINTDAEGRLILADGLAWASEQDPEEIIDLATLTGACVVALGHTAAGAFGDEEMVSRLVEAGRKTGDRAWPLPLYDEFAENMQSQVADIKNAGGHWGGASNAAAFLKFFLKDGVRWAHLDIAGSAHVTKPRHYEPAGATGAGVRLVTEYLSG